METTTTTTSSDDKVKLVPSPKEKMVAELVQGHDFAIQLKDLIQKPNFDGVLAKEFVVKIMSTFNQSLSMLTSTCDDHHQHQLLIMNEANSNQQNLQACNSFNDESVDERRSEDSGDSKKRPAATNSKDRRGCYKRKKNSQTWSKVAAKTDDGHAWRKYGQKVILNSKNPRNYFRCTRKYEQGCKATKQVQRVEDDPQMYHITYIGAHTCKQVIKAPPQFIVTSSPSPSPQNTNNNNNINNNNNVISNNWVISSSPPQLEESLIVKQEDNNNNLKVETSEMSDITGDININDQLDPMMWKDVMNFDDHDHDHHPKMGSDYGDNSSTSDCLVYGDLSLFDSDFLLNNL